MTPAERVKEEAERRRQRRSLWTERLVYVTFAVMMLMPVFIVADGFGMVESRGFKQYRLAVENVKPQAAALARQHRAAELVRRMKQLDTEDLEVLKPLVRFGKEVRDVYLQAATKHPFVAYALVIRNLDSIIARGGGYWRAAAPDYGRCASSHVDLLALRLGT